MNVLATHETSQPSMSASIISQPPLADDAASSASRAATKPIPEALAKDPRSYQLDQIRKRYSPKEATTPDGSAVLRFKLYPSDPDFAFELTYLDCELRVPKAYPAERPRLHVKNSDIPRGFGVNVERGWDRMAEESKALSLLALSRELDRNLEHFLSEQKVETVKLMAFKDTRHLEKQPASTEPAQAPPPVQAASPVPVPSTPRHVPEPSYTKDQIATSKARRAQEIRQIESRMGRLPTYRRSADGVVYTLPIEPKRRTELPTGLRPVQSFHLIVPLLYPLQDLRVQLNEVESEDAEPVEELFVNKAAAQKAMSLMSHVNYLAQNLHLLAKQAKAQAQAEAQSRAQAEAAAAAAASSHMPGDREVAAETAAETPTQGKGHIQVIPRPIEWSRPEEDSSDESSDDDDDIGGAYLGLEPETSAPDSAASTETPERGTMISFPSVELHGIELLQVSILSLSVKCERCRTANDMTGLKSGVEKAISCTKCATPMAAVFRQQLVHEHSSRAGFIDMSNCKVADMLPSTFVPTCGRCSTPSPGIVSVRGETTTNVCRECHGKFTFKIADVRFLFITPGTLPPPAVGPRRKQEKLGLHAGEPLPGRGACAHYRKSYRWFRFSCCARVHPCDKCHDDAEDHVNEWANRMVCGWCSREQKYAVDACGFCGRSVIGRKGRGFWEGGRGTRDQTLMSRKDPRKHKRIGHA